MKMWLGADRRSTARWMTLGLMGLVCLPVLALDLPDDKGQKSSRKGQNQADAESTTKPERLELTDPSEPPELEVESPAESGAVKLTSGDDVSDQVLSIERQQEKDQGECPGSEGSKVPASQNVNDVPLEQDEHPFDAPMAETEEITHADEDDAAKVKPAPVAKPAAKPAKSEAAAPTGIASECLPGLLLHAS